MATCPRETAPSPLPGYSHPIVKAEYITVVPLCLFDVCDRQFRYWLADRRQRPLLSHSMLQSGCSSGAAWRSALLRRPQGVLEGGGVVNTPVSMVQWPMAPRAASAGAAVHYMGHGARCAWSGARLRHGWSCPAESALRTAVNVVTVPFRAIGVPCKSRVTPARPPVVIRILESPAAHQRASSEPSQAV
jgi:hypothetical protein